MKKLTTEEFIEKSKLIHGDRYDYSLVDYINNRTKVKIICKKHGEFKQNAASHLSGFNCPDCYFDSKILTTEEFIEKSKLIHIDKYNYSLVNYKHNRSKIKIICNKCYETFEQRPYLHLNGYGCQKCGNVKLTTEEFIEKSKLIHGDKYDYSLVNYINSQKQVKIICKKCGEIFEQKPNYHLCNHGCQNCFSSKGEIKIKLLLEDININYQTQKSFKNCINIKPLRFDFFLPDYNVCIEYDGKQHYISVNRFGGDKNFKLTQLRDNIKNKYCKENNIRLIRIRYDENIEERLIQELQLMKK